MSLIRAVARLIEERGGEGTADDIKQFLPENKRSEILQALQNAKAVGLLEVVQRGKSLGRRHGSVPAVYRRTAKSLTPKKSGGNLRAIKVLEMDDDEDETKPLSHGNLPPRGKLPKVASVWELAQALR